jgi:hypothetical protein
LGKFWKVLQWKMLVFLWPLCLPSLRPIVVPILCSYGTFCGHLVHFFCFGILNWDKSGNPFQYFPISALHYAR